MMFLLDTNVLSEIMKPVPADPVARWLSRCPADAICTSAVSKMEILYGIGCLPAGQRRQMLTSAALQLFDGALAGRVLPFDETVAPIHAQLRIVRDLAGRPLGIEDGMIAAIARHAGATVVTRDVTGFAGCGLAIIDPWTTA